MQLTEVRVNLCGGHGGRLKAFCSLTFDDTFVVRDVKLIEGPDGLFLAMPSRKLCDHCPRCAEKNHLRARFCNGCGSRLDETRSGRHGGGNGHSGHGRLKLHADIAHPINAHCRSDLEQEVVAAYQQELERSKQPGYVAPNLDHEDMDFDDARPPAAPMRLRPTGTMSR
ncbi:MAG TPA: SpoVG family protein [Tepidisphaeraceae bacterium]|nr:SpoVG family protein [Tepidisphaeraceae bacterium]